MTHTGEDQHGEMIRRLVHLLGSVLRELGDAGKPERASEMAARGWVLLYKKMPLEAEYLNGVMHYLATLQEENVR